MKKQREGDATKYYKYNQREMYDCKKYRLTTVILAAWLLIHLISCQDIRKEEAGSATARIVIPKDKVSNESFLALFDEVRYVPLSTSSESIIQHIDKLIIGDSIILVFDKAQQAVFLFDREGTYLGKIDDQGKGPMEYVAISDVAFDERRRLIILNDPGKQGLHYFDVNGNFVQSKPMHDFQLSGPAFTVWGNHLLFNRGYYPIDGHYIGVFDQETLAFRQPMDRHKITSLYGGGDFIHSFYKTDSILWFQPPLSNEVYGFDKQLKPVKHYDLVFEGSEPNYDKINARQFNNIMAFDEYVRSSNIILNVRKLIVYGDYIYFNYLGKEALQNAFYHTETGEVKVVTGVMGDQDRYIWSEIMTGTGEELVGVIDNAEHVLNLKITHEMEPSEMESNPVLAFYRMNDRTFKTGH